MWHALMSKSIEQYNNYTDQVADVEIRVNGDNTQGNNQYKNIIAISCSYIIIRT